MELQVGGYCGWGRGEEKGGGNECRIEELKEMSERKIRIKGHGELFMPAQQKAELTERGIGALN